MYNIENVPTPSYVIDEGQLRKNLEILKSVEERTGAHILLAQKAFSNYKFYPLIGEYISGATASGLFEARLAYEEMHGENHIFSPAYKDDEFGEILDICDHIVFNSFSQWKKFRKRALEHGGSFGLRINPERSTQEHGIYDPCAFGSRLGITIANFEPNELEGISGLHFHTLCEQNSDDLAATLVAVEEKFGKYLYDMEWLNFGGGHHITRSDYDVELLVSEINRIRQKYDVEVYLEPGEAVALNAGYLMTTVCEIVDNGIKTAILDTSAACHMPDVLEMPYRPPLKDGYEAGEKPFTYRLSSLTCLAGDIIGDYSFEKPLNIGDRLMFCDMAIYTMVKNNTFNGMALPSIYKMAENGDISLIREFGYSDFKNRL
ncbi:MAG: carboxynorspermidine decarboxylase [Clostridia bacterium]|nr:carboxynorspermidine decarboxylase [Clostridia bacterium]